MRTIRHSGGVWNTSFDESLEKVPDSSRQVKVSFSNNKIISCWNSGVIKSLKAVGEVPWGSFEV